ncbi:MAG: DM13 domain-containing protein [Pseudomonadota bacterium]
MTGTVSIEREGGKTFVVLSEDFTLDGAPDPKLGFGNDGDFDADTIFAKLETLTGSQRYEVPPSLKIADYDTFTVWCEQFSVPLGSASLN